jgi:rare lipoprotein A
MERNLLFDVSAVYSGHASPAAPAGEPSHILSRCPPPRRPSAPPSPRSEGRSADLGGRQRRRQAAALAGLLASAALVSGACTGNHRPATPAAQAGGKIARGTASWYGSEFNGRRTANGERYDMRALTAAHLNLPFGSLVQVTNLDNGRQVVVRINDRGPFGRRRVIDVSYAAARQLGMVGAGTARVELAVLPANRYEPAAQPAPPILLAAAGAPQAAPAAEASPAQVSRTLSVPVPAESSPQPDQPAAPALVSRDPGARLAAAGSAGAVTSSAAAAATRIAMPMTARLATAPEARMATPAPARPAAPTVASPAVPATVAATASPTPLPSVNAAASLAPLAPVASVASIAPLASIAPIAPIAPGAPAAAGRGMHYTVQVGAFGEIERAGALQQELSRRYPEAAVHSDGIWNRVQIGLFGDRDEAEALQREIAALGLAAVVVAAR